MITHLIRLLWHRKWANSLLIMEMFVSFLVLVAVVTLGVYYLNNYRRPLGFSYDNVWNVAVDMKQESDEVWSKEMIQANQQVQLTLKSFPEIEAVGGIQDPPYSLGNSISIFERDGKEIQWILGEATDGLKDVLGFSIVEGRWFDQSDDASTYRPVVINRNLAREFFGAEDPVGKLMTKEEPGGDWRVVGVVDEFRKNGELIGAESYAFLRINPNNTLHRPSRNYLVRVQPGTPVSLQQTITEKLQNTVKAWSFEVQPLSEMRRTYFKTRLGALFAGGLIVGNLILMVALGLIGVLWQNVTRRRSEIGLRRALGAAASDIYRQVLVELLIIASFGIALAMILIVQFPLLGVFRSVSWSVYMSALVLSLVFMYGIILLAALYPSRIATRIQPIEALHCD